MSNVQVLLLRVFENRLFLDRSAVPGTRRKNKLFQLQTMVRDSSGNLFLCLLFFRTMYSRAFTGTSMS